MTSTLVYGLSVLRRVAAGERPSRKVFAEPRTTPEGAESRRIEILELLRSGPLRLRDLADRTGRPRNDSRLKQCIRGMVASGLVIRIGHGLFAAAPENRCE